MTRNFQKKTIYLSEKKISYTLIRSSRARNIRLVVDFEKGLQVILPIRMDFELAERFIIQKKRWIVKQLDRLKKFGNKKVIKSSNKDYYENKHHALRFIKERLDFFNSFYKFPYNKVAIRNQNTIWGSCTRAGNLQFNYKLAQVSAQMRDYVIVHELCHLREHNHSPRFWKLVAQMIPDYKIIRRQMRDLVMRTD